RRHTRFSRDWSSDVCSSDLVRYDPAGRRFAEARGYAEVDSEIHRRNDLTLVDEAELDRLYAEAWEHAAGYELVQWSGRAPDDLEIGRASCRESVERGADGRE